MFLLPAFSLRVNIVVSYGSTFSYLIGFFRILLPRAAPTKPVAIVYITKKHVAPTEHIAANFVFINRMLL